MSKGCPRYEPVEHTADVGVRVFGRTLGELLENAAFGLFDTIADLSRVAAGQSRTIELDAADIEDLLVRWLSELNFLFQTEQVLFSRFAVEAAEIPAAGGRGGFRLRAEVRGQAFDPARHEIRADVKGITYHDLDVRKGKGGWEASVIFDV